MDWVSESVVAWYPCFEANRIGGRYKESGRERRWRQAVKKLGGKGEVKK